MLIKAKKVIFSFILLSMYYVPGSGSWECKNKPGNLALGHMKLLINGKSDNKSNQQMFL